MKCFLGISNFLEEISSFSHSIVFSISLHYSLKKAFLSLPDILWNSAFRWVYLSFSPLLFASLLFLAVCKASSDNHFAFLHFFFLEMVLITTSCTILWTSVQSFFRHSIRSYPLESVSHLVASDSCNPMDCSLPGFNVHWIHQARIPEWIATSFSRGSSQPKDQT